MNAYTRARNLLVASLTAAMLATGFTAIPATSATAQVGTWYGDRPHVRYRHASPRYQRHYGHYPRYRYNPRYRHYRHRSRDAGAAVTAGIIGLGVGTMLGAAASEPRYYDRPPQRRYDRTYRRYYDSGGADTMRERDVTDY